MKKATNILRTQIDFFGFLQVVGGILCLLTLAGFLGRFWWLFDLTSHFRVQYALVLILIALILLAKRRVIFCLVFLVFSLINASQFLGLYSNGRETAGDSPRKLRVMLVNVRTESNAFQKVLDYIRENAPDMVVLEEINQRWAGEMRALGDDYPYHITEPSEDNFGIALLSKHRLSFAKVLYLGTADVPSVYGEFKLDGFEFAFLGTHPLPPGGKEYTRHRNQQLADVAEFVQNCPKPVVLIGDLNVTPWNYYFQRLMRETGLVNCAAGYGLLATWPTRFPPAWVQIDHCLTSTNFVVKDFRVGKHLGSDHYPLIVDLAFAE